MLSRSLLLGGIAAAALSLPAYAGQGWYLGIESGAGWVEDATFAPLPPPDVEPGPYEHKIGWALFATAGYAFANHWRVEGEAGYRVNGIEDFHTTRGAPIDNGDLRELTLMANVLYDVPLSDRLSLSLGAGAGADRARIRANVPFSVSDSSWDFAYQGIASLNYALSEGTTFSVKYHYLRDTDPSFDEGRTRIDVDDYAKHTLTVGLRFALGRDERAAPPAPLPAPAAPPAPKSFVSFFGYNKCNITAEADQVLSEAASAAKSQGAAAIQIVGHTDTSGSPAYNQKLSECRANAAATNLEAKGIPESAIRATGVGEADLMVQTGDGVKEPQNRRATVDLQ